MAFYVSGQLLTEDYYVANKLMKGFIGSANIDTNSRLCMASTVAAQKRAFGSDTVPGCYEDFDLADLVVLVGSNTAWCHPVIFQRILAAKQKRPEDEDDDSASEDGPAAVLSQQKKPNFELPELVHNINLIMDTCEEELIASDRKLRHNRFGSVTRFSR